MRETAAGASAPLARSAFVPGASRSLNWRRFVIPKRFSANYLSRRAPKVTEGDDYTLVAPTAPKRAAGEIPPSSRPCRALLLTYILSLFISSLLSLFLIRSFVSSGAESFLAPVAPPSRVEAFLSRSYPLVPAGAFSVQSSFLVPRGAFSVHPPSSQPFVMAALVHNVDVSAGILPIETVRAIVAMTAAQIKEPYDAECWLQSISKICSMFKPNRQLGYCTEAELALGLHEFNVTSVKLLTYVQTLKTASSHCVCEIGPGGNVSDYLNHEYVSDFEKAGLQSATAAAEWNANNEPGRPGTFLVL